MTTVRCINHSKGEMSTIDSVKKVGWLKQNAVNIRTIDPADEDFSDLMPLKKIIGDAQVVMIGEPNHFIGSVYLAKTRLIKFLHQDMNFDLLSFESGMYDLLFINLAVVYGLTGILMPPQTQSPNVSCNATEAV